MQTTISEMTSTADRIYGRLHITKVKMRNLEAQTQKLSKMKQRENRLKKRAPMDCRRMAKSFLNLMKTINSTDPKFNEPKE